MTHLWFVRHGPTHEKAFVGWRDVPADLSDTALIKAVSDYLPADAKIISSDLIRCVTTADALQSERQRLDHLADLREFNFGIWDGMTFDKVAERDPVLSRQYWEQPGDIQAPDGESWNEAATRINRAVDNLVAQHQGHIIVVAHFGAILTQVARAAGITPYETLGHSIDNLSVTDMTFSNGQWAIGTINHVA